MAIPLNIGLSTTWLELSTDLLTQFSNTNRLEMILESLDTRECEILIDTTGVAVIDDSFNGKGIQLDIRNTSFEFDFNTSYKFYARGIECNSRIKIVKIVSTETGVSGTVSLPANALETYLKDGSSNSLKVDGSSTPVEFIYNIPPGKVLYLNRLLFAYESSADFSQEKFANLTALANGIDFEVDGNIIANWKTNNDVKLSMYDTDGPKSFGSDKKQIYGRFTMARAFGESLKVSTSIKMIVNDNLSTLIHFEAKIQGLLDNA